MDRGFGRRPAVDARDARFPMGAALRPRALPSSRYYKTGTRLPLDQGQTSCCVAFAWTGFLYCAPMMTYSAPNPYDTYRGLVLVDEWSENDREATLPDSGLQFGSSVRAGAKYFQAQGRLTSYVWAANTDEMAKWLLTGRGPIVLGTDWYWDMSAPDASGVSHVGGGVAGGHAYLCHGYNAVTKRFRCMNSWGPTFGQKGRFWIAEADMAKLLADGGEACAAVEKQP